MEEAEQLCDYIVIIDHGLILKQGTISGLLGEIRDLPVKPAETRRITLDDLFTSLTGRHLDD
jgi:ABC-type multidrug transport system ATPase subunit